MPSGISRPEGLNQGSQVVDTTDVFVENRYKLKRDVLRNLSQKLSGSVRPRDFAKEVPYAITSENGKVHTGCGIASITSIEGEEIMKKENVELGALKAKLEEIINVRLARHKGPVPPRLVRANSAFELQAALLRFEESLEQPEEIN